MNYAETQALLFQVRRAGTFRLQGDCDKIDEPMPELAAKRCALQLGVQLAETNESFGKPISTSEPFQSALYYAPFGLLRYAALALDRLESVQFVELVNEGVENPKKSTELIKMVAELQELFDATKVHTR